MIYLTAWLMMLWGCAETAYLCVLLTGGTLNEYERLLLPVLAGGAVLAGALCALYRRWRRSSCPEGEKVPVSLRNGGAYLWVLAAAGVITLSHFAGSYVVDLSDAVYEMAINTANSGLIMGQHPFTGRAEGSIPMRLQILGLSALYAAVMDLTGLSPYTLMGQIVPVLVWLGSLGIFFSLGRVLLEGREKYLWLFVGLAAVGYLLTAHTEGMAGYWLFYAGFSGETIRACILLPYCLLACCKKQWLLALLAAVCETTLVWTTYGVGYCALVIVVSFAVTQWQKRRARG